MAKRVADTYLTDQNWDKEEDDGEERGAFSAASSSVMSQRTVIKAKRRCNPNEPESSTTLFKGFSGFSKPDSSASSTVTSDSASVETSKSDSPKINFPEALSSSETPANRAGQSSKLSELNKKLSSWVSEQLSKDAACDLTPVLNSYCVQVKTFSSEKDNGTVSCQQDSVLPANKKPEEADSKIVPLSELFQKTSDTWDCSVCFVSNKIANTNCVACTAARPTNATNAAPATKQPAVTAAPEVSASSQPSLAELFKKSSDEWECKSCWVRNKSSSADCVACGVKNPTSTTKEPQEAESSNVASTSGITTTSTFSFAPQGGFAFKPSTGSSLFSFGSNSVSSSTAFSGKPSGDDDKKGATFNFGASSTSTFSFKPAESTSGNFGFSFKPAESTSGSLGFSFKPAESTSGDSKDDEEYVPPVAESVSHTESEAFYSVRCKLFYQKDGQWVDRGLGNLFLKPCGDCTQLLVRTETSLGNILLNVLLTASIPVSRQGSNNVSLVCVPNPPLPGAKAGKQPVCMLVRVKNSEMADELFAKINESKSKENE